MTKNINMNLLRLKDLLNEKKITGKQLADSVGVTPASISNIVKGNSFPKPELLVKISEALDVEVRDLFKSKINSKTIYLNEGEELIVKTINK